MKTIGFIGVGVMGRPMVKNLLQAGYAVAVYSRTRSKLTDFLAETGVQWCDTAAECAAGGTRSSQWSATRRTWSRSISAKTASCLQPERART